jgi:hypothetical protein
VHLAEKRHASLPHAAHPEATAARRSLAESVDVPHEMAEPAIKVRDQIQPVIVANLQTLKNRRQVARDDA